MGKKLKWHLSKNFKASGMETRVVCSQEADSCFEISHWSVPETPSHSRLDRHAQGQQVLCSGTKVTSVQDLPSESVWNASSAASASKTVEWARITSSFIEWTHT